MDLYELGLFVNRRYGTASASTDESAEYHYQGDYRTFVNMAGVGVVYIGPLPDGHGHFPRVVNLVVDPQGPRFKPSVKAERPDPSQAAAASTR